MQLYYLHLTDAKTKDNVVARVELEMNLLTLSLSFLIKTWLKILLLLTCTQIL